MNRYAAAGLLDEVANGKRVLLLVGHQAEVRSALHELERVAPVTAEWKILRGNGRERVEHASGGRLRICSTGPWLLTSVRGCTLDVVFVDDTAAEVFRRDRHRGGSLDRDVIGALAPALASSGGTVVQA